MIRNGDIILCIVCIKRFYRVARAVRVCVGVCVCVCVCFDVVAAACVCVCVCVCVCATAAAAVAGDVLVALRQYGPPV
jgi:hypothetical protein